jgi:hypothetical protein
MLLLLVALPIFLGAMFLLGLYVKQNGIGVMAGPNILPPTAFDSSINSPTALLVRESGVITYQLPESDEVHTLEMGEISVPTGTTIKTDSEAVAHVVFPDNSLMSLSKDTEVVLDFEENRIKIFQILGNTWHRVEKVLQGNVYEVETPNTLATVRGTEFNVGILPDGEAEVYVIDSVVDVSKIVKENDQIIIKETQSVQKDQHVLIPPAESDTPMKVDVLPPEKKNSEWFQRNKEMTEVIKKAEEEARKASESGNDRPSNPDAPRGPENNNSPKPPTVDLDALKKKVREEVLHQVVEKSSPPTPKPNQPSVLGTSTEDKDSRKEQNENKKEEKKQEQEQRKEEKQAEKDKKKEDKQAEKDAKKNQKNNNPQPTVAPTEQPTPIPEPTAEPTAVPTSAPLLDVNLRLDQVISPLINTRTSPTKEIVTPTPLIERLLKPVELILQ